MNLDSLKTKFAIYLENVKSDENGQTGSESVISDSDISIFMHAKEFKEFVNEELDTSEVNLSSLSVNDILNMEVVDGKLVDPEEEADEVEADEETEETPDEENVEDVTEESDNAAIEGEEEPEEETEEIPEETETDVANKDGAETEIAEGEEKAGLVDIFNEVLNDEQVKSAIDGDGNGELSTEEVQNFFQGVANSDNNSKNVSLDDVLSGVQGVATDESAEKAEADAEKETEKASKAGKSKKTSKTKKKKKSSKTSGSSGSSAASGSSGYSGDYSSGLTADNYNSEPKTLKTMSKEELKTELSKAKDKLSEQKGKLSDLLSGNDSKLQSLKEKIDSSMEAYTDEITNNISASAAEAVKEKQAEIDDAKQKVDDDKKAISDQKSIIATKKQNVQNAEDKVSSLKEAQSALKDCDTSDMDAEQRADISQKKEKIKTAIEEAEKELDKAKEDYEAEKKKLEEELEPQKTADSELVLGLTKELSDIENNNNFDDYPEIQKAKEDHEKAQKEYETYKDKQVAAVQKKIDKAQKRVDKVQTALNNLRCANTVSKYAPGGGVAQNAIELAFQELASGVHETKGDNRGENEKYGAGAGAPWCAAFVSWCFNKGQGNSKSPLKFSASVSGLQSQAQSAGHYANAQGYTPQAGDVMIQKNNGASHTGIVVGCDGKYVYTIEGNSGDRVAQRKYAIGDYSKISGYVKMGEWTGTKIDNKKYIKKLSGNYGTSNKTT